MNNFGDSVRSSSFIIGFVSSSRVENSKIFHSLPILNEVIDALDHFIGIILEKIHLKLVSVDLLLGVCVDQNRLIKFDKEWNIEDVT